MKYVILISILLLTSSCGKQINHAELENDVDSLSYFLGVFTGLTMKESGQTDFNKTNFDSAVMRVLTSEATREGDYAEADSIITWYIKNGKYEITLQKGREFLSENKKRKEIKSTASGLQYEVLHEGTGPTPQLGDSIKLIFTGTTLSGVAFMNMNNYSGGPRTMLFKEGTRGGIEGIQLMREGSRYKFYLPTELAYGKNPQPGGPLEPNMAVIYDVELLSVIPQKADK